MFNSVSNPFGQRIESAISTNQERKQHQQEQKEEKKYLEDEDNDKVDISPLPALSEDDIIYLTKNYIEKLKTENENNPKTIEKLDKFLEKFNVKKFMKQNPNLTSSDFYMIMYNEVADIL